MVDNKKYLELEVCGSSCISSFKYDKEKKILRIYFQHGGCFDYGDIEEALVRRWMRSESKGKFFNKEIRNLKVVNKWREALPQM